VAANVTASVKTNSTDAINVTANAQVNVSAVAFKLDNKTSSADPKKFVPTTSWEDQMKEMSDMNSFNAEEDKAIAAQLDGEELVKSIQKDMLGTTMFGPANSTAAFTGAIFKESQMGLNKLPKTSFAQQEWYINRKAGKQ
jgi:hypothetical protein